MKNFFYLFLIVVFSFFLNSCQTIQKKVTDTTEKESKELSKWINQPESELLIVFGKPDKETEDNMGSRFLFYKTKKLAITCERIFELNNKNMVIGFSSKNCF